MRKKASKKKNDIKRLGHGDLPASVSLVKEVRDELRAHISSKVEAVQSNLEGLRSNVESLRSEVHGVKAELHEVKGRVDQVLVAVHASQVLFEEQRSENRIVLDGIKMVMERQDRVESRLAQLGPSS